MRVSEVFERMARWGEANPKTSFAIEAAVTAGLLSFALYNKNAFLGGLAALTFPAHWPFRSGVPAKPASSAP